MTFSHAVFTVLYSAVEVEAAVPAQIPEYTGSDPTEAGPEVHRVSHK